MILKRRGPCRGEKSGPATMSLGAERRLEARLRTLEELTREPRSAINLESLLVSRAGGHHSPRRRSRGVHGAAARAGARCNKAALTCSAARNPPC